MFDYVKGILEEKSYPYCTIENNGIGYRFLTTQRTLLNLGELNSEVKIYTKLIHKEDIMFLCGFKTKQDRILFDIITSVSGIGTKAGLSLLDEFDTNELINAIVEENYKLISKTKGIGLKTAQKLVLEIKDKLTKSDFVSENITQSIKNDGLISKDTISQTIAILDSLGYSQNEYQGAIETALTKLNKDDPEELLKEVLQILSIF